MSLYLFQILSLVIVCSGLLFTAVFQIFTPERKLDISYSDEHGETHGLLSSNQSKETTHCKDVQEYKTDQSEDRLYKKDMTWIDWLKEFQFYQV